MIRHCERSEAIQGSAGLPRRLRLLAMTLMAMVIASGLSACGTKGKLKSPSQIEAMQAKKQAKAQRKAQDDESSPSPPEGEGGVEGLSTRSESEPAATPPPSPLPQGEGGR